MKIEDVKKVGVLGAGKMGHTIATTVSLKFATVLKVRETGAKITPQEALKRVSTCYPALVRRGKITEQQKEEALSRITITGKLEDLKDCQVIIDALPDDLNLKSEMLSQLNHLCPPQSVFTTTSSIFPITSLAAASGRPEHFIGTHFCIPAHMMALVEVAPALQTNEETVSLTTEFCKHLGKVPVKCKDKPGFIVNYLFFPYLLSAVKALEAGLGTVEEIDTAMKLGL
ncbi:MAG: 3-hydroxyacyl-CoA dehydrogenase family protein, partial [Dehalococcoidia bacterium]|nr:3-hydroxyacyl-CoA dehydrogenase family protein [Dehalococcoidia bacterium]